MRAAISKFIGLTIFISAACAFADTKLPKCVIFTFGNCQGSLKYPNGDIYTGEFNYGQPNGAGKMTYANGDLYAGNFFEGQKYGVGDYTWADGNRYIGQFIGGNLEGRGAYYFLSKNKSNPDKYVGDFKKNVFNGDGIYTYGNGAVVSGKFKDGKKVNISASVQVAEVKKSPEVVNGVNELNKPGVEVSNKVNGISENNQEPVNKELLALSVYSDGVINGNSLSGRSSIPSNRSAEKGKFFVTGSMNSVSITALNVSNGLGSTGEDKLNMPLVNTPFSLGVGYQLNESYGIELGFKYHGHYFEDIKSSSLIQNNSLKSSAWLFGGFMDLPLSASLGLNIKAGIQNADMTLEATRERSSFSPTGQIIYSSGQFDVWRSSSKSWGGYYGLGLYYSIDKDNSIYLDWSRARSSVSSISNSSNPSAPIDINTDVTGLGFKHSF